MRTCFVTPKEYEDAVFDIVSRIVAVGEKRPERFMKVMRENRGSVQPLLPFFGPTADGLERKNPVIVVLGDSVTAGHFEFNGSPETAFGKLMAGEMTEKDFVEITDARECYPERFRSHLIDYYEHTSVSVINAGIAGDTIFGMQKRLYRDVIRYQPDLVIINGSLNWSQELGSAGDYENVLTQVVESIKQETKADIVLLTPNMERVPAWSGASSTLEERVEVIRRIAVKCDVCLADAYKVWKQYEEEGYPVEALLANGCNHPSVTGHEVYARVLMQLIEK